MLQKGFASHFRRIGDAYAWWMALSQGEQAEFHIAGQKLIIEKSDELSPFKHRDLIQALNKANRHRLERLDGDVPEAKRFCKGRSRLKTLLGT